MEIKPAIKPGEEKPKQKKTAKKTVKKTRLIDELNPKNKEFLLNYFLLGMNGRKAYLATYPNTKPQSAEVMASRLLSNVKVSAAKQEFLEEHWDKKEEMIADLFYKLKKVASSDISDFINEAGDIRAEEFNQLDTFPIAQYDQSISQTETTRNEKRSIKLMDKQKAISDLTKILGMIKEPEPPKLEIVITPAEKPEE